MVEANDLFSGWADEPPVYISVKAIIEALGGGSTSASGGDSGIAEAEKAAAEMRGSIPLVRGKDPGLPKAAPVFDLNELRTRNKASLMAKYKAKHG